MHLKYTKNFLKHFAKRVGKNTKLKLQFEERLELFLKDPKHVILKDHKLIGTKKHLRTFSITGDVRVLYYQEGEIINFIDIGTHNQVY